MGLNYRDARAIGVSRFWRGKKRLLFWMMLIIALISTLVIFTFVLGREVREMGQTETLYISETGQQVSIIGSNIRLDGELLEKASVAETSAKNLYGLLIALTPMLAWVIGGCVLLYKGNRYETKFASNWEKTREIPDLEE